MHDIVIILKGLHISRYDVQAMKSAGAWVVLINHDDFFSSNPVNWSSTQRRAISEYDFVFVTRRVNVNEVRRLNSQVEFFPFAFYPRIHRPIEIVPSETSIWNADVSFVGTWELERCALLEYLVQQVPAHYAVWGNQWDRVRARSPLRPFIKGRSAVMDDLAKAIGGAAVSL